jgi:hypothetical protein
MVSTPGASEEEDEETNRVGHEDVLYVREDDCDGLAVQY